jgi:hypothetical protein
MGSTELVLKRSPNIPDVEVQPEFLQGMVNRRMQGYLKYGSVMDTSAKTRSAYVENIADRVRLYLETGNTEWLMDAAVFAWLEFTTPSHENAHFRATGNDESPGALLRDGTRTHGAAAREEAARVAYAGRPSGD